MVLLASSPKKAEFCFSYKNVEEKQAGRPQPFNYFIPYTDMSVTEEKGERRQSELSLRSALYRYIFVQGNETLLEEVLREWNRTTNGRIYFLRNDKKIARISSTDMEKLMKACSNDDIALDLQHPVRTLKPGDEITLANTPFEKKDTTYTVLEVRKKGPGIYQLQVEMKMFGVTFKNMYVTYTEEGDDQETKEMAALVCSTQKKLLDIFKRKVKNKGDERGREQVDADTLQSIYEQRDIPLPSGARKRHWLALMLICSHLMGQHDGKQRFLREVESELAAISKLRESKAATDTRAYLHIALYIATGNPMYRELAKIYVRKHAPSSVQLCQFVSTMSKHEASKVIGHTKKKRNMLLKDCGKPHLHEASVNDK